jgi:hypothetical protein
MLVAVGHAMRHLSAPLALIAVTDMRFDQRQIDDGDLLTTSTTFIVDGYAKPAWWIATPKQLQPNGYTAAAYCVVKEQPCLSHHVAEAGISVLHWQGGNLPADEDLLYHWEDTQSGFTVLGFALVTGLLVFAGAYALGGEVAGGAFSTSMGTGSVIGDASAIAGVSSAGYVGLTDIMHPGSAFDSQGHYLGSTTGTGELQPAKPTSEHERALQNNAKVLQINRPLTNGLSGVGIVFAGNCDPSVSTATCRRRNEQPGITHRTDSYTQYNAVLSGRKNGRAVDEVKLFVPK